VDGDVITFRERLWPSVGTWAFATLITISIGVAFSSAVAPWVGLVAFIGVHGLTMVGLVAASPVVHVDDRVVRAATARLPLWAAGDVEVLDASGMRRVLGLEADAGAFLVIRPWVRAGVRLWVGDVQDPHPYWVIASRRPRDLAEAIRRSTTPGNDQ
jgi:hypothetical protein